MSNYTGAEICRLLTDKSVEPSAPANIKKSTKPVTLPSDIFLYFLGSMILAFFSAAPMLS